MKKDDERIQIVRLKLVCAVGLRAVQDACGVIKKEGCKAEE